MGKEEQEALSRGRFKNVVNSKDLPQEEWAGDMQKYGAVSLEAALAIGAKDLGFCIVTVDPGKRSCPFHFHHSEEEMFYVLSGTATLRQGKTEVEEELLVEAGDFISFPANTGIAHQFLNATTEPFVYLAVSTKIASDVCEYPDSDKILIRRSRTMLRRQPNLEYFDGEH
ncbi:MAG: putative cupin superfamily protein [Planctomycetota bacterium]|jgi:uncharacterized cupin superfamily protein